MPEQSIFATATRPERMVAVENETARISGTMPSEADDEEEGLRATGIMGKLALEQEPGHSQVDGIIDW